MSFAQGFYRFNLTISDTTRNVYATTSVKIARHPEESLEMLYSRILGFSHSYEDELTLSGGLFQPKDPTAYKRDILNNTLTWLQVGCPSQEKLVRALRTEHHAHFCVYLLGLEEVRRFCHYLRGARTNWVRRVRFFLIDTEFLAKLATIEHSSARWTVTIVDNLFYLVFDEREFETTIDSIDIWERFQQSLREEASGNT